MSSRALILSSKLDFGVAVEEIVRVCRAAGYEARVAGWGERNDVDWRKIVVQEGGYERAFWRIRRTFDAFVMVETHEAALCRSQVHIATLFLREQAPCYVYRNGNLIPVKNVVTFASAEASGKASHAWRFKYGVAETDDDTLRLPLPLEIIDG